MQFSMDKLPNKKKESLYLNFKCQTHPEVNFGTLKMHFAKCIFKASCSSMDKMLNKEKSKPLPQF